MTTEVDTLVVKLTTNTAELMRGLSQAGAKVDDFQGRMAAVGDRLGGIGRAFGALGGAIQAGLTAAGAVGATVLGGIVAIIGTGSNAAADMEQRVADIAAAMGLTGDQTARVSKLISDLGLDPNLKVSATEAADVIGVLGTAGVGLQSILDGAAKSTVMLANATGADFAQAAAIASDSMAIFGLTADDLDESVSNILATTQASKFGIGDYAAALAQGGGVASATGVSFKDFNTTIAAISPLFAGGADAGTSFKTFLQRLIPQSKEAVEQMRALGLFTGATKEEFEDAQEKLAKVNEQIAKLDPTSRNYAQRLAELQSKQALYNSVLNNGRNAFFDANGNMKSMAEIAGIMQQALSGLSDEQKNNALSTIFGADAMRAAVAIAKTGEQGFRDLATTMEQTDVGNAMATRMDTFKGAWEIFKGVLEALQITIGNNFLPVFKDMVQWATSFASANVEPINSFFAGLAGHLTAVWEAFKGGGLTGAFQELQNQLGQLWGQLAGWLNSSGIADTIRQVLATWSAAFAEWGVNLWGTHVWPRLTEFWGSLTSWVTDAGKQQVLIDTLAGWAGAFGKWAGDLWSTHVLAGVTSLWGELSSWVTDDGKRSELLGKLGGAWNQFSIWAEEIYRKVAPHLLAFWTGLSSWVTDDAKRSELLGKLGSAWNQFSIWAAGIWATVSPKLAELWDQRLKPWLDEKAGGLGTALEGWSTEFADFVNGTKETWEKAWPKIQGSVTTAKASITEDVERIMQSLARIGGWFQESDTEDQWSNFWADLVETVAGVATVLTGIIANIVEAVSLLGAAIEAWKAGDWARVYEIMQQLNEVMSRDPMQEYLNSHDPTNSGGFGRSSGAVAGAGAGAVLTGGPISVVINQTFGGAVDAATVRSASSAGVLEAMRAVGVR